MNITNRFYKASLFVYLVIACFWSCQDQSEFSTPTLSLKQGVDSLIQYTIEARNYAPDSIVMLSDRIIQSSTAINYFEGEVQGIYHKAIGYFYISNYQSAEENCQIIIEKLETTSPIDSLVYNKYTGITYILKGVIEQRKGNYQNALSLQLEALEKLEKIKDEVNMAHAYSNISENFRFIKNFDKALFYNKKAEELFIKTAVTERVPTTLVNRGNILFDQKKYKVSLEVFKVALDKATEMNDFGSIINAINNIGASNEEIGNFEIALDQYMLALEKYQERKDTWGEANTKGNISMVFLSMGQFEKAKDFSEKALAISQEHGFLELEKFSTENLAQILEREGEYENSLSLLKQAQALQDSLYNEQKFEAVNRLERQFNEERSNRIIAQKNRDLAETQLQSLRLRNFAILLGMFLVLIFSGAWLFYRQAKFRKEKNQELLHKNTIIQNQNTDLESLVNAYESQREKYITLGTHEIQLDEIIYIRYKNRVSSIFLKDQSIIEHRTQLSQLMAELNYKSHFLFSQINQNYILCFKNVNIRYNADEEDKYYFTTYLSNDQNEYRNEEVIRTRIRSGITKNFEREYQRFLRLKKILT